MKKYFLIGVFLVLGLVLAGCEQGGVIYITNNYSGAKSVNIYSDFSMRGSIFYYNKKYGPKTITAGDTEIFYVENNTKYGIVWSHNGTDRYKQIDVSNGESIVVEIP